MNRHEYVMAVVIAACRRHEANLAYDGSPSSEIARLDAEIAHDKVFTEASLDEALVAYEALARLYPDCCYSQFGAQAMWTLYAALPEMAKESIDGRYDRIASLAAEVSP